MKDRGSRVCRDFERKCLPKTLSTPLDRQVETNYDRLYMFSLLDEAITNYQVLQDDNYKLKQRLDQQRENLQQLNELASMLQESHR